MEVVWERLALLQSLVSRRKKADNSISIFFLNIKKNLNIVLKYCQYIEICKRQIYFYFE